MKGSLPLKLFLGNVGNLFKRFWRILTEPFVVFPKPEDRRRAIISTVFLLFSFIAVGIER
jgi:hypothetical protein